MRQDTGGRGSRVGSARVVATMVAAAVLVVGFLVWSWMSPRVAPAATAVEKPSGSGAGIPAAATADAALGEAPSRERLLEPVDDRLHEVRFVVSDPSGEPLRGVDIVLTVRDEATIDRSVTEWQNVAYTDADGIARIRGPSGHFNASVNTRYRGLPSHQAVGQPVMIGAETVTTFFMLRPLDAALLVRVLDDVGTPLQGVRIHVSHLRDGEAVTDERGEARFDALPACKVFVRADLGSRDDAILKAGKTQVEAVELQSHAWTTHEFRAYRQCWLEVGVRGGGAIGDERIAITVMGEASEYSYSFGTNLVLEVNGDARTLRVPPGSYVIRGTTRGDSPVWIRGIARVSVRPGEVAVAYLDCMGTDRDLAVEAVDESGRPVPALSLAFWARAPHLARIDWVTYKRLLLDDSGQTVVRGLPEGRALLLDVHVDHYTSPVYEFPGTAEIPYVEVGAAERGPLRIVVRRGRSIVGRVTDSRGRGVESGTVHLYPYEYTIDHRLDLGPGPDGTLGWFRFDHLRRGTYRLWFGGDPRSERMVELEAAGEVRRVDLRTTVEER